MMHSQKFTYGELKQNVKKLLERYSSNGAENTVGEVFDIEKRLVMSANTHLRKLYDEFGVCRRTMRVSFEVPKATFDFGSFEVTDEEIISKNFGGNRMAYRIVAGGNGDLVFFESGSTPRRMIETGAGEIGEFCGLIETYEGAQRFLLAGAPLLKVYSFEIYTDFSENEDDLVLLCGKDRCAVRIPEDCSRIMGIYRENGERVSLSCFDISDKDGTISAGQEMSGVYTIDYLAHPAALCEECADDTVIRIPPVLFDALCYMCAAQVCPSSDGETYSKLTYKYREILENYYDRTRRYEKGRNSFFGVVRRRPRIIL